MNINVTLFIQVFVFVALIVLIMRNAWPQFEKALDERADKISKGLADAERAAFKLKEADATIAQMTLDAKKKAREIIDRANKNATDIVEEARLSADQKAKQIIEEATFEIEANKVKVKDTLMQEVSSYAMLIVKKVLAKQLDKQLSESIIKKAIEEEVA
ncbi:MAG: ATP synthase F0 subunit B [Legionellales bacterium]|nr:ATP synthase F0 subunit B [Legionellales bacterium]|tara:strand:+ start:3004 stop:3480 length:477 start_codon:yes stop_codon:yes gene_type:complete